MPFLNKEAKVDFKAQHDRESMILDKVLKNPEKNKIDIEKEFDNLPFKTIEDVQEKIGKIQKYFNEEDGK